MNRTVVFGIAIFLALVGIALLGGENTAQAGHGCHGCDGCGGLLGGCHGCSGLLGGCHGCGGLLGGCGGLLGGCHGCVGLLSGCGCDSSDDGDDSDGGDEDAADEGEAVPDAPADAAMKSFERAPVAFRTVSFRR